MARHESQRRKCKDAAKKGNQLVIAANNLGGKTVIDNK